MNWSEIGEWFNDLVGIGAHTYLEKERIDASTKQPAITQTDMASMLKFGMIAIAAVMLIKVVK